MSNAQRVPASYSTSSVTAPVHEDDVQEVLESSAQRFARLATKRTNRAIKTISLLKNLSNRSQYEYTSMQVNIILASLRAEIDAVQEAFEPKKRVVNAIDLTAIDHVSV